MKAKGKALLCLGMSAVLFYSLSEIIYASEAADEYSHACRICHTGAVTPDVHHILAYEKGLSCFGCHQFKNDAGFFYITNDGNYCFLNCHAPMLYRDNTRFFDRVTPEIAEASNWDISAGAKRKIGDFHHQNYGVPLVDCSRCHEFYWDPELGAQNTRPVAGSAGEGEAAENINNINIVIENDQLVYDIGPKETVTINAMDSEGDITTVRWSINNQQIPAAADNLIFTYTFKWAYPGDTYVVKLEVWSSDGRYAKQNIGVNIR